ncbi:MAG: mechanosensitive ion channel family protein [Myxococcota bacterium]
MPTLLMWTIFWLAPHARAADVDPCANPRSAVQNLFDYLGAVAYDPDRAATCFEIPPGTARSRVPVQLVQVFDARGLYVPVRDLPDDPDYLDDHDEPVVVPVRELPEVAVVRGDDGRWRFSEETVRALPDLYAATFSALSEWFQSRLPPVFYTRFLGIHLWQVCYAGLLLLFAWGLGTGLRMLLKQRARSGLARLGLQLDAEDWQRTNRPLVAIVVLGVVYWGLPDLQLPIDVSAPIRKALWVGVWIAGVLLALRFVTVGAGVARSWAASTESKLDDQAIPLLRQATQLLLLVVGVLYIADAMGFDVWKLAAGVGIGGLAFALAAQDTVANVFGSVNIFLDRPFQIGDWVKIGDVEGVVEEVGFRSTRVRTFYNSLVTIPNSQITSANVDNLGLRPRRRIKLTLGVTYDTPPDVLQAYVEGVRAVLAAHPKVQRSYEVHVYDFGPSSIDILVYYHVVTATWSEELDARAQNLLEFVRVAKALGVSFAFPSTSVYVESTPEHPLAERTAADPVTLREAFDRFGPGGRDARPLGPDFGRSWSVPAREAADRGSAE